MQNYLLDMLACLGIALAAISAIVNIYQATRHTAELRVLDILVVFACLSYCAIYSLELIGVIQRGVQTIQFARPVTVVFIVLILSRTIAEWR